MSDDLLIIGGLDQSLPVAVRAEKYCKTVDEVIFNAKTAKNPDAIISYGLEIISDAQARGIALAKLLSEGQKMWEQFGLRETFEDCIYAEWGMSRETIHRYVAIWRMIFENNSIPVDVRTQLAERPVYTLRRLVRPAREDVFTDADWREIVTATDHREVIQIIHEKTDAQASGRSPLVILLYSDGTLQAFQNGNSAMLGVLRVSPKDLKNELRWRAIDRIKRGAGILEKQ
jgi:hypothetical protein